MQCEHNNVIPIGNYRYCWCEDCGALQHQTTKKWKLPHFHEGDIPEPKPSAQERKEAVDKLFGSRPELIPFDRHEDNKPDKNKPSRFHKKVLNKISEYTDDIPCQQSNNCCLSEGHDGLHKPMAQVNYKGQMIVDGKPVRNHGLSDKNICDICVERCYYPNKYPCSHCTMNEKGKYFLIDLSDDKELKRLMIKADDIHRTVIVDVDRGTIDAFELKMGTHTSCIPAERATIMEKNRLKKSKPCLEPSCNHIWRVDGEELPTMPLDDRIKLIPKDKYVWLRKGEEPSEYELCEKCEQAVRIKHSDKPCPECGGSRRVRPCNCGAPFEDLDCGFLRCLKCMMEYGLYESGILPLEECPRCNGSGQINSRTLDELIGDALENAPSIDTGGMKLEECDCHSCEINRKLHPVNRLLCEKSKANLEIFVKGRIKDGE